jgi:hypothetical protein
MSLHSDTLFWFRANQSFILLLNVASLTEKQQIPILYTRYSIWLDPTTVQSYIPGIVFGLTRPQFDSTIYQTRGENVNHYPTNVMCIILKIKCEWVNNYSLSVSYRVYISGSPNQAKWATFSPWFQWNRPISVKKWSVSRPVSLFKSVFFPPIIILFLQYSRKRSCHVPEIWPIQGLMFNILFQTR